MSSKFTITLKHENGERKVVNVEYVAPSLTYLTVRWEMAGMYDLNLSVNCLTPRQAKGQLRGKARWYRKDKPQWKAEDIISVRKMAKEYIDDKNGIPKAKLLADIAQHKKNMPVPIRGLELNTRVAEILNNCAHCRLHGWPTCSFCRRAIATLERALPPEHHPYCPTGEVEPFPHYEGDPDPDEIE